MSINDNGVPVDSVTSGSPRLALHFAFVRSAFIRPISVRRVRAHFVHLSSYSFYHVPLKPDFAGSTEHDESPNRRTLLETNAWRRARSVTVIRAPIRKRSMIPKRTRVNDWPGVAPTNAFAEPTADETIIIKNVVS